MSTFDQELAQHSGFLRRLAGRLTLDESSADDLTQETLVAALGNRQAPPRHLPSWLAAVVSNRASLEKRRALRRSDTHADSTRDQPRTDAAAGDAVAQIDLARRLLDHVDSLDEPLRDVVVMRYFEDLPPRQIAQRIGIPTGTVKTRIARGLARLRERLDADSERGRESWLGVALAMGAPQAKPAAPAASSGALVAASGVVAAAAIGAVLWSSSSPPVEPSHAAPPSRAAAPSLPGTLASLPKVLEERMPAAVPAQSAPKASLLVQGLVLDAITASQDAGTTPAPGVTVRYGSPMAEVAARPFETSGAGDASDSGPVVAKFVNGLLWRTTTAGPDGRFSLRIPDDQTVSRIEVLASETHRNASWQPEGTGEAIELIRRPKGSLQGIVLDTHDRPVAGVRVEARRWTDDQEVVDSAISGPDGRFTSSENFRPHWFTVRGGSDHFALAQTRVIPLPYGGYEDVELRVTQQATLRLVFEDPDGTKLPTQDATVAPLHHEIGCDCARFTLNGFLDASAKVGPNEAVATVPAGIELGIHAERNGVTYGRVSDGLALPQLDSGQGQPIVLAAGETRTIRVVLGDAPPKTGDPIPWIEASTGATTLRLKVLANGAPANDAYLSIARPIDGDADLGLSLASAAAFAHDPNRLDPSNGQISRAQSAELTLAGIPARIERHRIEPGRPIEVRVPSGPAWINVTGGASIKTDLGEGYVELGSCSSGWVQLTPGVIEATIELPISAYTYGRVTAEGQDFEPCVALVHGEGQPILFRSYTSAPLSIFETGQSGHFTLGEVPVGAYVLWIGTRGELERGAPRQTKAVEVTYGGDGTCSLAL